MSAAEDQAHIDELFAAFGAVQVRRMFGGAGLFAGDTMFGLLHDGVIYLKADEALATAFAQEGSRRFTYRRKGVPTALGYWRLPERLYDDPDELAAWAKRALACANEKLAKARRPRARKIRRV